MGMKKGKIKFKFKFIIKEKTMTSFSLGHNIKCRSVRKMRGRERLGRKMQSRESEGAEK